ncbi:hypothetical protein HBI81_055840 [Parastagonospora nodorum]|nr:hypothetical protein HBH47_040650 [Parastagonospora nodorum]KAH4945293.1 hypothetical protein HBI79_010080 [Parastagonospora nodorum]KAH6065290.1 hypothetical protein HBI67_126180 [Parastagonospora nodorum]KAH6076212.1 hypothetical protein HBI66_095950 [Parastagonospora nodorum]KAH6457136.1 hypothetical protein HBI57_115390 [Parastagonospora nodorum]
MSHVQFVALIRLPFARGHFVDPPQAQWDADKDRQLWKVISKSSKTSDLNWVELADKFQVPPTFLLQQAAWLYERHLDHVRNQMKKVSGSGIPVSTNDASTLTAPGGIAMLRTGSGGSGAQRSNSALSGRQRESPSLRGGEPTVTSPPLSRTPSTNTITQSRAIAQQPPLQPKSTRTLQRPVLPSPRSEDRLSTALAPPSTLTDTLDSPGDPDSLSSSSSSSSDTDHPAHRSQLFKRPPRFKLQQSRNLSSFKDKSGSQGTENSGLHGASSLPFASITRRPIGANYVNDIRSKSSVKAGQHTGQDDGSQNARPLRQNMVGQQSQRTKQTASSVTNSTSESDLLVPISGTTTPKSPQSIQRTELDGPGNPKQKGPKLGKEGSEGTPSMGSSFSDIDDAGISQSALEEALLSNMQHGRMSTLSRMSRYI